MEEITRSGSLLTSNLLALVLLIISVDANSGCLGIKQPLVPDASFSALKLDFLVHADTKWTGLNQSIAVNETFAQSVTINVLYNPQGGFCNSSVVTWGDLSATGSRLTDDVSQHVGKDFSAYSASLKYTTRDAGYVTTQNLTYSAFDQILTLETSKYGPVLNPKTGQYFYSSYQRGFATADYQVQGFYTVGESFQTYLSSLLGSRQFGYYDVATLSQNYTRYDKYGYTGTATLTNISTVPLPGAVWLCGSALMWLMGASRLTRDTSI